MKLRVEITTHVNIAVCKDCLMEMFYFAISKDLVRYVPQCKLNVIDRSSVVCRVTCVILSFVASLWGLILSHGCHIPNISK